MFVLFHFSCSYTNTESVFRQANIPLTSMLSLYLCHFVRQKMEFKHIMCYGSMAIVNQVLTLISIEYFVGVRTISLTFCLFCSLYGTMVAQCTDPQLYVFIFIHVYNPSNLTRLQTTRVCYIDCILVYVVCAHQTAAKEMAAERESENL